jgi:DNA-binding MarR family transcriptional regulator
VSSHDDQFAEAWEEFFRAARRARGRAETGTSGLTMSQWHLLQPLAEGPRQVGELASAAGVSPPTATRMLDGLAKQGLIERAPKDTDRRCVVVAATDDGRHAIAAKRRQAAAVRRRIAHTLEPDEREQAAVLLRRLADVMEDL